MKVIVLLAIVSAAWAQSCDNSFEKYLNSLKDEIGKNAQALEQEFKDDYYKLATQCFDSSSDSSKCYLSSSELNADPYGDDGPMKGCTRCQQLAKKLHDVFMKSDDKTRSCFRRHLSQAIAEELEPCIQGKISNGVNFHIPKPLPDFDEKTFQYMNLVEPSINYHVICASRLDACNNVNPPKYAVTKPCMDNEFPNIYAKHCQAAKNAKANAVSSGCEARFQEVKGATCQCMRDKRDDWHQRFQKVQDTVNNAVSGSQCANDINRILGSWIGKLQDALKDCMPQSAQSQQQTQLSTLIELGCGQVVSGGVKKNELTVGFRFVRLLLDALNERILIFCDKNCSF